MSINAPRKTKPPLKAGERVQQLRGLVIHGIRAEWKPETFYLRGCVYKPLPGTKRGTCKWCLRPCKPTRWWHTECIPAYQCARGNQRFGIGLPEGNVCAQCGKPDGAGDDKLQIDHRRALVVAFQMGWREFVKAHDISNLQFLCASCHAPKSGADRKIANLMRAGESYEKACYNVANRRTTHNDKQNDSGRLFGV